MDQARKEVHCEALEDLGLTGKGVCVAVLDTGIFPHRDFGDRIIEFRDCLLYTSRCV